jgi:hypothetical protein
MKKIILIVLGLILIGTGIFYWWQNQADVRELNKTLPDGVKVTKSVFGDEYRVVNKIDGYELKIPPEWINLEYIEYFPETTEQDYVASSMSLEGKESPGRIVNIARFKLEEPDIDLELWVENYFEASNATNEFEKEKIANLSVIKTKEFDLGLSGYAYFFKKGAVIFAVAGPSKEFISYVVTNGQW